MDTRSRAPLGNEPVAGKKDLCHLVWERSGSVTCISGSARYPGNRRMRAEVVVGDTGLGPPPNKVRQAARNMRWNPIHAVFLLAVALAAPAYGQSWDIEVVDQGGASKYTALKIDN